MAVSFQRPKYVNKPFSRLPLRQRAVFVLHMAGFTIREIAKLVYGTKRNKVSRLIIKSYKEYSVEYGTIPPKYERKSKHDSRLYKTKILYVGDTSNLEYLDGVVNHRGTGGGRRKMPHIHDDVESYREETAGDMWGAE